MARISIWLLAAVAAVGLAHATTTPQQGGDTAEGTMLKDLPDETLHKVLYYLPDDIENVKLTAKRFHALAVTARDLHFGGKVFYDLRHHLGLPVMKGSPTLVGLQTLLECAETEFLYITHDLADYLNSIAEGKSFMKPSLKLLWPDLFQHRTFPKLDLPELMKQWASGGLLLRIRPNDVKHSLANLGLKFNNGYIVGVVGEFFKVLGNGDLRKSFETIADLSAQEPSTIEDVASTEKDPAEEARMLQIREHRGYLYDLWLKVIDHDEKNQLRYYLENLLAYNVIPRIIGQVLESDIYEIDLKLAKQHKYEMALDLAKQLHQLDGVKRVIAACPENAPNYYEFILLYMTQQKPQDSNSFLPTVQAEGNLDVQWLYRCLQDDTFYDRVKEWAEIFEDISPNDLEEWSKQDRDKCAGMQGKYTRGYLFSGDLKIAFYGLSGETTDDYIMRKDA